VTRESGLRDGRLAAKPSADLKSDSDRIAMIADDLLAAAAARLSSTSTITIVGAESHVPGRWVLLVSAAVPGSDADERDRAASAIDLELDSARVTGHRLLASTASTLTFETGTTKTVTGSRPPLATLERVTALYEIEIVALLDPGGVLGTARVRDDRLAKEKAESPTRDIVATDVTRGWRDASVTLRLAVLGAEIASLSDDASPDVLATLRAELERLRAESNGEDARRAGELLDVLSR
jgi:hypothetical protein